VVVVFFVCFFAFRYSQKSILLISLMSCLGFMHAMTNLEGEHSSYIVLPHLQNNVSTGVFTQYTNVRAICDQRMMYLDNNIFE
jgi:hypothetical protein